MDEFKKFLRENRHLLDVESAPRSQVWEHIQQHGPARKKMVMTSLVRWIAAACIVLLTGAATYMLWPSKTGSALAGAEPQTSNLKPQTTIDTPEIIGRTDTPGSAISPLPGEVIAESAGATTKKITKDVPSNSRKGKRPALSKKRSAMDMLQENYASIINQQLKKLEATPIRVESPGYFHAFKKHWYDMEKDEKKIKDDIQLYGLNDAVLTQFIQLYQQKLLLLKQLQDEINKMNNRAQQYPEMQTKSPLFLKM
jgi:hypothetical protein